MQQTIIENCQKFSPKELEILRLISEGHSSFEIGKKLFLSVDTIKSYRKKLMIKFQARNVAGMIRRAIEQRILVF